MCDGSISYLQLVSDVVSLVIYVKLNILDFKNLKTLLIIFFFFLTFSCFLIEKLNIKSATEYKYLRQSNCYLISGVDDAEEFRVLMVLYPTFLF